MQINIEKKHLYIFSAFLLIILGITIVFAYGTNNPQTLGHTVEEVEGAVKPCDKWPEYQRSDILDNEFTCYSAGSTTTYYWADVNHNYKLLKPEINCEQLFVHELTPAEDYSGKTPKEMCNTWVSANQGGISNFATYAIIYGIDPNYGVNNLRYFSGLNTPWTWDGTNYNLLATGCCWFEYDTGPQGTYLNLP